MVDDILMGNSLVSMMNMVVIGDMSNMQTVTVKILVMMNSKFILINIIVNTIVNISVTFMFY